MSPQTYVSASGGVFSGGRSSGVARDQSSWARGDSGDLLGGCTGMSGRVSEGR
ncbi:hypothetical protein ACIBF1_23165 [Spirillospora sp. NPDC050679]